MRQQLDTEIQDKYIKDARRTLLGRMPLMTIANAQASPTPNLDPTIPAPMTNVAEYGFGGRFEDWADRADWADQARYFEYSKAANPIGSGYVPQVRIKRFGPET